MESVDYLARALQTALSSPYANTPPPAAAPSAYGSSANLAPPPASAPAGGGRPDPSLMIADPAEYQRQYEAYTDARLAHTLAQVAAPIAYSMADTGKALSQANSEVSDVWKRWGPEVESLVAHIPPGNRNRAMWDQAAKFVRSNHVDELVEEKAREKAAQYGSAPATEGSSYGAPPASAGSDPLGQFWNSDHPYAGMLKSQSLTLPVLRDRISRMKVTPENWLKSVNSNQIIPVASGGHRGFTTTQRAG